MSILMQKALWNPNPRCNLPYDWAIDPDTPKIISGNIADCSLLNQIPLGTVINSIGWPPCGFPKVPASMDLSSSKPYEPVSVLHAGYSDKLIRIRSQSLDIVWQSFFG
jgi:hypothetical protein